MSKTAVLERDDVNMAGHSYHERKMEREMALNGCVLSFSSVPVTLLVRTCTEAAMRVPALTTQANTLYEQNKTH